VVVVIVAVIGCGWVGLVSAVLLAEVGHRVVAVEVDPERRQRLLRGEVPFSEPGLEERLHRAASSGGLTFAATVEAARGAEVVLICVPTRADDRATEEVVAGLARVCDRGAVLALRGTLTPDRAVRLAEQAAPLRVVANPEFLRVGRAVEDFLTPARVVLGGEAGAVSVLRRMYAPLYGPEIPYVRTDLASACLGKLAANAMLSVRVGFANEVGRVAAATGASMDDVVRILALDPRIGGSHLHPSLGFGGSCLPKDAEMALDLARALELPLGILAAAVRSNEDQLDWVLVAAARLCDGLSGRRVALWGWTFKALAADARDSPAVALHGRLEALGAEVAVHDPATHPGDPRAAVKGADLLVVATGWPEYRDVDPRSLAPRSRVAIDPSRVLGRAWLEAGWTLWPG
jgi:UDPglucose 6-dehydrogenase